MRIAMAQMTSGIDPQDNAQFVTSAIAHAAAGGAAMLFAPEMSGLVDRDRKRAARHVVAESDNHFVAAVREAAARAGIWVHAGSVPVSDAADAEPGHPRWHNRSFVIDDTGEIRARYDKIHLFDVDLPGGESWRESSAYVPGTRSVAVDTPLGRLGLTICYDLRFAELFLALAQAGCGIITVPSAFTVPTGQAHWHVLLRARAIETGAFIVAPAQCGSHTDGRTTYGHSLVIDPWGNVLLDMADGAGVGFADIDLTMVNDVRQRLPALDHRRDFTGPQLF